MNNPSRDKAIRDAAERLRERLPKCRDCGTPMLPGGTQPICADCAIIATYAEPPLTESECAELEKRALRWVR